MIAFVIGAVFVVLRFTAPADQGPLGIQRCAQYLGARSVDGGTTWTPTALYATPDAQAEWPKPALPGTPDSLWVSVSTATSVWLAGGTLFRVSAVDSAGNVAEPGNWTAVVAGPDTLWTLQGSGEVEGRRWRVGPVVKFEVASGRGRPGTFVRHQEWVQRRYAARIRQIYGYNPPIAGGFREVVE